MEEKERRKEGDVSRKCERDRGEEDRGKGGGGNAVKERGVEMGGGGLQGV
jgi:hypothetical protein